MSVALCCGSPLVVATPNISSMSAVNATTLPDLAEVGFLQMLLNGAGVDGWQNYARAQLTPEFFLNPDRAVLEPSIVRSIAVQDALLMPSFVDTWRLDDVHSVSFSFDHEFRAPSPLFDDSLQLIDSNAFGASGLQQTIFSPGYQAAVSDRASIGVAAVIAYQQFASWGMGSFTSHQLRGDSFASGPLATEQSYGAGLSLGLSSELSPGLRFGASYRTEIDMDSFNSYRGVFSEPGDFDIPAAAMVGFQVDATPTTHFNFDIEHVMYSDVDTFTTSLLPDRFLSALGDSTSPSFDWDDLTIYRVGWAWDAAQDLTWRMNYSTRRQPAPTSNLLRLALSPEFADDNYTVGFTKYTERLGRFNVNAHYAPSYLYAGQEFGSSRDLEDQIEFEALWTWEF